MSWIPTDERCVNALKPKDFSLIVLSEWSASLVAEEEVSSAESKLVGVWSSWLSSRHGDATLRQAVAWEDSWAFHDRVVSQCEILRLTSRRDTYPAGSKIKPVMTLMRSI